MMTSTSAYPPAVQAMAYHVLQCLLSHRVQASFTSSRSRLPPLFVGVQGPQGSGKTFLTSRLRSVLTSPPHSLSVAVLSIDDLYLPHAELVALAEAHPHNRLLHGRGLPGTHDVALGGAVLRALKTINNVDADAGGGGRDVPVPVREVALPVFDKSLFNGEGDRRVDQTVVMRAPVDVVLLEGWCVGFYPVQREVVEARWQAPVPGLDDIGFDMQAIASVEDVLEVNGLLGAYVEWWQALDTFIQIRGPSSSRHAIVYRWRLQQEQDMKAKNGGQGMTDEQVKTFVDRYIPGYVFFEDGVRNGMADEEGGELPPWHGRGMVLELGLERQLRGIRWF